MSNSTKVGLFALVAVLLVVAAIGLTLAITRSDASSRVVAAYGSPSPVANVANGQATAAVDDPPATVPACCAGKVTTGACCASGSQSVAAVPRASCCGGR